MLKKLAAAFGLTTLLLAAGLFVTPPNIRDAIAANIGLGQYISPLPSITPQTGDYLWIGRGACSGGNQACYGNRTNATNFLMTNNNLSDVTNKSSARSNIGFTGSFASIIDYGGDRTGGSSSDTAFTSCITSGSNCYLPTGTYLISCAAHNALLSNRFAPITIFGDGYNQSYIRIASGCSMPAGQGLINLANMRDVSIDVNSATAAAASYVISNHTASQAVSAPEFDNVWILNAGNSATSAVANITGFHISGISGQGVNLVMISDSVFQTALSSTTPNQCISALPGAGFIATGRIMNNQCLGSGIDVAGTGIVLEGNYIANWFYRSGIYTEPVANSANYQIVNNRLINGGTALVGGMPTDGITNGGSQSIISNNYCNTIGGACVSNAGQKSSITGNSASAFGKRNDGFGGPAYYSNYIDATFNGNGSIWTGNYASDDGTNIPTTTVGFGDAALSANNSLMSNYFVVDIPYQLQD